MEIDLCEKIHRKTESLSRSENEHYYDKHDLDLEGKPKQKHFAYSFCQLKSPLTCNDMIRKDGCVADVYAAISGIRLLYEVKEKLALEVKK